MLFLGALTLESGTRRGWILTLTLTSCLTLFRTLDFSSFSVKWVWQGVSASHGGRLGESCGSEPGSGWVSNPVSFCYYWEVLTLWPLAPSSRSPRKPPELLCEVSTGSSSPLFPAVLWVCLLQPFTTLYWNCLFIPPCWWMWASQVVLVD